MTTTPGIGTLGDGQTLGLSGTPPREPADAAIMDALSRGETRTALTLCVERHGASIGRLCMAMLGSKQDADAVTEETLLSAQQSLAEARGSTSVRAYLFGIARDRCLRQLEMKRRPATRLVARMDGDRPQGSDPGVELRARKARALLEQLRPSDREALLLRFAADLSFEEVAAACRVDERTARQRACRALLRLRTLLESEHDDE